METFKLFVSHFSSGTKLLHGSPREQEGSVSHSYCVTWYWSRWCDTRERWTWESIFMFLPNLTQTAVQLVFLAESDFLACEQTAVATLFIYKRSETLSRRMLSVSQLWLWSIFCELGRLLKACSWYKLKLNALQPDRTFDSSQML